MLFSVALQGVFIGAEGGRVPVEVVHEGGSLDMAGLPRKRGLGRVSAALWWRLATRFGAWLLLVRPSGRFLLEAASWLLIFGFGYNLGIKLPRSQIFYPRICDLKFSFFGFYPHPASV